MNLSENKRWQKKKSADGDVTLKMPFALWGSG